MCCTEIFFSMWRNLSVSNIFSHYPFPFPLLCPSCDEFPFFSSYMEVGYNRIIIIHIFRWVGAEDSEFSYLPINKFD